MTDVIVIDIETTLIPPEGKDHVEKIHCIVCKKLGSHPIAFHGTSLKRFKDYVEKNPNATWVAHNGVGFDFPILQRLLGITLPTTFDTFIVSRLVNYSGFNTHGLEEFGQYFRFPKGHFKDFDEYSDEMLQYCIRDVEITEKVYTMYKKYINDPAWQDAIRLEHDMVTICEDMERNGFAFDATKAKELLTHIQSRMTSLETMMQEAWPPQLVEDRRLKYRVNKDGSLNSTLEKSMLSCDKWELDKDEVVIYKWEDFNPGSVPQRIQKLWEAGWRPFDRTKTHLQFSRTKVGEKWGQQVLTPKLFKEKQDHFNYYGWKVNEDNLSTLPESAPEAAQRLAEWLTLEGRRSSLEEWLGCVRGDGRIHGKFWFIGSWTHRMSHSNPNQANIVSPFHGKPTNAVQAIKSEFDGDMRALWQAGKGSTLVGTDADGIQLRILAHYLKNDDYVHAIVTGKKEDETDIHNLNRRSLALNHINRDDAKTFIYAWLLGAGTAKVASILRCNQPTARAATQNFLENTDGLTKLKKGQIVLDAKRGYFKGVDGRKVVCNSEHLMLAGYLQNAESIIMKRSCRLWRQWADSEKIVYKQVDFVHDEWQTECYGSQDMCERLGQLQRASIVQTGKDLKLYCPLAGSTDFGKNWMETH